MWTAGKRAASEKVLSMGISDAVQEAMAGAAAGIPLGTGASLAVSELLVAPTAWVDVGLLRPSGVKAETLAVKVERATVGLEPLACEDGGGGERGDDDIERDVGRCGKDRNGCLSPVRKGRYLLQQCCIGKRCCGNNGRHGGGANGGVSVVYERRLIRIFQPQYPTLCVRLLGGRVDRVGLEEGRDARGLFARERAGYMCIHLRTCWTGSSALGLLLRLHTRPTRGDVLGHHLAQRKRRLDRYPASLMSTSSARQDQQRRDRKAGQSRTVSTSSGLVASSGRNKLWLGVCRIAATLRAPTHRQADPQCNAPPQRRLDGTSNLQEKHVKEHRRCKFFRARDRQGSNASAQRFQGKHSSLMRTCLDLTSVPSSTLTEGRALQRCSVA
ncbi:hypothetical protein L1887_58592 [Cichorium endivia]|nr:hypothetical protein L1887_58592 [Cichorium endivia]